MKGHTKYLGILSAGLDSLLEVLLCYFWGKICYFCVVQGGKGRGKQNPVSVLHVTKFASVWVKEMEKKTKKIVKICILTPSLLSRRPARGAELLPVC